MFFSSITKQVKLRVLQRACLFAFPGCILILYMGIFLSSTVLESWGLLGFIVGFSLIAAGMIPHRRVTVLESKPHELSVEKDGFQFVHARKGVVMFPYSEIERMHFVNKRTIYGIRLYLREKQTFFLPYFSRRTYDIVKMDETNKTPTI